MAEQGETLEVPEVTKHTSPSTWGNQHSDEIVREISFKMRVELESEIESKLDEALLRIQQQLGSIFESQLEAAQSELKSKPSVESTDLVDGKYKKDNGVKQTPAAEIIEPPGLQISALIPQFVRNVLADEIQQMKTELYGHILKMLKQVGEYAFDELKKKYMNEVEKAEKCVAETEQSIKK